MMNVFLEATKTKLRVPTSMGALSVEQLWDLNLSKLAVLIRNVKKNLASTSNDSELSFLDLEVSVTAQERENQLIFDILKEIYLFKKNEKDMANQEREKREFNQKVLELIKEKQENGLKEKSIEELMAMLKS